ncbi:hypothetical protein BDV96DRAFT_156420 [Lophiotrema nucula]|uniref:Rhodopsin domain-containing protein n=1 Tax=Lophiotrema nucula TaxID=690887 RepID=A0A6A5Z2U0_9PLEO|nr:hypothetical protein BDV96DRAFT_156420 [Lophiotrema nucula]
MTKTLQSSKDTTRNFSNMAIWAAIEIKVGIICASLGLLPAFLDRHLPKGVLLSIIRLWSSTAQRENRPRSCARRNRSLAAQIPEVARTMHYQAMNSLRFSTLRERKELIIT